jgi:nucleoside-diphosphate-sugar epimerase
MNPAVLVTGANGFTGSRLCRYLAERDFPVWAMHRPNDGVPEISDADRAFDIGKARKVLGHEPQVTPDEGLKIMALSYRKAGWNSLMSRLRTVLQRRKTYAAFPFRGCREAVRSPPRRST